VLIDKRIVVQHNLKSHIYVRRCCHDDFLVWHVPWAITEDATFQGIDDHAGASSIDILAVLFTTLSCVNLRDSRVCRLVDDVALRWVPGKQRPAAEIVRGYRA